MSEFVEMPADDLLPKPAAADVAAVPTTITPEPAPDVEPAEAKAEVKKKPRLRTWVLKALLHTRTYFQDADTERRYYAPAKLPYNPFEITEFKRQHGLYNTLAYELESYNLVASPRLVEEVVCSQVGSKPIRLVTDKLDYLAARWDGQDHLANLLASVRTDDSSLFGRDFRHWLLSVVAQVYDSGSRNDYAFVLVGGQGVGKTGFFERTLFDDDYFAAPATVFNFNNKEDTLLLTTKILVLLDEMSAYGGKADIGAVKSTFSLSKVTTHKKYQESDTYRRMGSFCGTTNRWDFLRDDTGDRRFLVHPLHGYDHDVFNAVDKMQLWGQLTALYKQGAHTPFTQGEIQANMDRNTDNFSMRKREDQFIEDMLCVTKDPAQYVTVADMMRHITQYDQENPTRSFALSITTIRAKLQLLGVNMGPQYQKKIRGKNCKVYSGVCLRSEMPASSADVAASLTGALFVSDMGQMSVPPDSTAPKISFPSPAQLISVPKSTLPLGEEKKIWATPVRASAARGAGREAIEKVMDGRQELAAMTARMAELQDRITKDQKLAAYTLREAVVLDRGQDWVSAGDGEELLAEATEQVTLALTSDEASMEPEAAAVTTSAPGAPQGVAEATVEVVTPQVVDYLEGLLDDLE